MELTYYGISENSGSALTKIYINKTLAIYREFRSRLETKELQIRNKGLVAYTYARMHMKKNGFLNRKDKLLCGYAIFSANLQTKAKALLTLLKVI